ncbi:azurin [Dokdonella sp.]|uniref:azurin n=1 Tax=Dokdonella sp. TaxID=2291710 RepID=UPI0031BEEC04|nr:azurin [Dokdonella sp.]
MNIRISLLAGACLLALAACGNQSQEPAGTSAPPESTTPASEPTQAPATAPEESAPATPPAAAPAASDKPAAVVTDCATTIVGSDAMQYDVGSITVPASCTEFKITLNHSGSMPVAAMGHNVVIAKASDMAGIDADGMAAGIAHDYVKPDDPRVIAHTKLIGGGESTSVSFDVSKIKTGGPYEFFCSFPGHSAIMHGSITVQ